MEREPFVNRTDITRNTNRGLTTDDVAASSAERHAARVYQTARAIALGEGLTDAEADDVARWVRGLTAHTSMPSLRTSWPLRGRRIPQPD